MEDIYYYIFTSLQISDIYYVSQVNKEFYKVTKLEQLWCTYYFKYCNNLNFINNYYDTCKKHTLLTNLINNHNDPYPPIDISNFEKSKTYHIKFCSKKNIPNEISLLKNLEKFFCIYTDIEIFPKEILTLNTLTHLQISNTRIKEISTEISLLENLVALSLAHNYISVIPTEIGRLRLLSSVTFYCNRINFVPKELANLTNIRMINLEYNYILKLPKELKYKYENDIIKISTHKIVYVSECVENVKNSFLYMFGL